MRGLSYSVEKSDPAIDEERASRCAVTEPT
jgi:hypothetical protein